MAQQQKRAGYQALVVGLSATLLVVALYLAGALEWLEVKTLDLRFQYANSIPQHPDLLCVDIDDGSLDLVGRWPWPRDVQAGVLGVLAECEPKALLIDITLGEPETIRSIAPDLADVAFEPLELAQQGQVAVALPDLEIRAALKALGAAYLSFDYSDGGKWHDILASDAFADAVAELRRGRNDAARQSIDRIARPSHWAGGGIRWDPWLWARATAELDAHPTAGRADVVAALGAAERAQVDLIFDACRDMALRGYVTDWLNADPARWTMNRRQRFDALLDALGPGARPLTKPLGVALRRTLSLRATTAHTLQSVQPFADVVRPVLALSPAYFEQAEVVKRCGFVVFEPDGDGVVRRMRLLARHGGCVLSQIAFTLACDELAASVDVTPGRIRLTSGADGAVRDIQLDARGNMIIPWVAERDWTRQFAPHVPVGAAWQVFDRRNAVRQNRETCLQLLPRLAQDAPSELLSQYGEDVTALLHVEQRLRLAQFHDDDAEAAELRALRDDAQRLVREDEGALLPGLRGRQSSSTQPALSAEAAHALGTLIDALAANVAYQRDIEDTLARLRGMLRGRIGLLGYTATSLADMAPIPTHPRAPGVMAHANLLNGILSGRLVSWAPAALNVALTLLLGLLATLFSVRGGPRDGLILALILVAYVGFAGWYAFFYWLYWIQLVPPTLALVVSYVAVLLFRYIFLERERRQLTTALGQYTSATLARRMAEDPELCKRAEAREVTAMFTDLASFTTISERIGAERTQHVLNVSLGRFSDAILRHEGMINKFIGDGIFAFWNPVIYPQPDHARRACDAAVDLVATLRRLIEEQRRAGGDEVFADLFVRVGVATGSAVVGPCGSEQKYDYTCIGDSVNVASRLESANKFYGTRALVSAATVEQAGDGFAWRPLGRVQVKGKTQGVPIFELLGRRADASDDDLRYADAFGRAIELFQQRAFERALESFGDCFQSRPEDKAAQRYIDAANLLLHEPPDERWSGAIELMEK